jgi:hypothetical protein
MSEVPLDLAAPPAAVAAEIAALAERQDYVGAGALLCTLVLSGALAQAGPLRPDLLADVVHAGLKHRPDTFPTVVNYAFFISASTPQDAVVELGTLLAAEHPRNALVASDPRRRAAVHRMRGVLAAFLPGPDATSAAAPPSNPKTAALADLLAGAGKSGGFFFFF